MKDKNGNTVSRTNKNIFFKENGKAYNTKTKMNRALIARLNNYYGVFDVSDLNHLIKVLASGNGVKIAKIIKCQQIKNRKLQNRF